MVNDIEEFLNDSDLFGWYIEYQKTDEFKQELEQQLKIERDDHSLRHLAYARRSKVLNKQGTTCALCGEPLDADIKIDHIVPVSRGGKSELNNLQAVHASCNHVKGSKMSD